MSLNTGNPIGCSVLTSHGRISCRQGDTTRAIEIVLPPVLVQSTKAEDLHAGLLKQLPLTTAEFRAKARHSFTLVLNTDSGKPCQKLARFLKASPAICRMHQHCLALVAPLRLGGVMSPLFCAPLLLKRKRVQTLIRKALLPHIECEL